MERISQVCCGFGSSSSSFSFCFSFSLAYRHSIAYRLYSSFFAVGLMAHHGIGGSVASVTFLLVAFAYFFFFFNSDRRKNKREMACDESC